MKSTLGEYEPNNAGIESIFPCPVCGQVIEELEEGLFDPCEHVIGCFPSLAGEWEVLDERLREKWNADTEENDVRHEDWGKANIPATLHTRLVNHGMACGPITCKTDYFFSE